MEQGEVQEEHLGHATINENAERGEREVSMGNEKRERACQIELEHCYLQYRSPPCTGKACKKENTTISILFTTIGYTSRLVRGKGLPQSMQGYTGTPPPRTLSTFLALSGL